MTTITKRIAPLVLALVLLIAPASALAKTGKPDEAIKSSVAPAPVRPQSGCDQDCNQALFDGLENCNGLHYIDEAVYADCVGLAQRNWALCRIFCSIGGILGKARPKSAIRSVVRLTE